MGNFGQIQHCPGLWNALDFILSQINMLVLRSFVDITIHKRLATIQSTCLHYLNREALYLKMLHDHSIARLIEITPAFWSQYH